VDARRDPISIVGHEEVLGSILYSLSTMPQQEAGCLKGVPSGSEICDLCADSLVLLAMIIPLEDRICLRPDESALTPANITNEFVAPVQVAWRV
jgi:hypothetical protein